MPISLVGFPLLLAHILGEGGADFALIGAQGQNHLDFVTNSEQTSLVGQSDVEDRVGGCGISLRTDSQ